jgi:LmbE family N-acetylglucosaminyl deacetylase
MIGPSAPPNRTETVRAKSILVLAPHYDDEVLGCGGLLAQLAGRGAVVRVLFLTDGAGGQESPADAVYAARRSAESESAGAALGLAGADHLGLPDGGLELRLADAAEGIRRALLTNRPDLLLAPSPLEATPDHRAAFAALHRVLSPLRGGAALDEVAVDLRVLLYEVNHPAYPDLLIDVAAELPRIEAAMACYASQEERHPYLQAGLGLRAFRALSLGPERRAVEAYRSLRPADFITHGLAALTRTLGGVALPHEVREGPKISVIVRTKDRPELLREALESLAASTYRRLEVVLVNDGGAPPTVPEPFPFVLVNVELPENRGRAAAANAGVAAASGDHIAFLDDDDLIEPGHFETLAALVSAAGVRGAYTDAAVGVYELDGKEGWRLHERRLPYSHDFDAELLLVDNYIPFNTLLLERALFDAVGPFDTGLPFFEDWDFLIRLSRLAALHHLRQVTCEYRQFRGSGHHILGDRPRERGDFIAMKERVLAKHAGALSPALVARVVDGLRARQVATEEELAASRRRAREAESRHAELDDAFHRTHGEVVSLRGERERLQADVKQRAGDLERSLGEARARAADVERQARELERVYAEESRLRGAADEQGAHIVRLHAELERLNRLVRDMEATRAWRLHRWWHRS